MMHESTSATNTVAFYCHHCHMPFWICCSVPVSSCLVCGGKGADEGVYTITAAADAIEALHEAIEDLKEMRKEAPEHEYPPIPPKKLTRPQIFAGKPHEMAYRRGYWSIR